MTGPVKPRQLESVDVQQRAGFGPFIAARALRALATSLARHAIAAQNLPDRRAVPAAEKLQLHRPQLFLSRATRNARSLRR